MERFFHLLQLIEVERQKGDQIFCDLLSHICVGQHTENDVDKLLSIAQTNQLHNNIPMERDLLYLYPSIKQCDEHNSKIINQLGRHPRLYSVFAEHYIIDRCKQCRKTKSSDLIPKDDR